VQLKQQQQSVEKELGLEGTFKAIRTVITTYQTNNIHSGEQAVSKED
jgi:hypothetical protein